MFLVLTKVSFRGGSGGYKWDSGWGAGSGPEHLTSADTFQSGGAQFALIRLPHPLLWQVPNRVVDLMLVSAVDLSRWWSGAVPNY